MPSGVQAGSENAPILEAGGGSAGAEVVEENGEGEGTRTPNLRIDNPKGEWRNALPQPPKRAASPPVRIPVRTDDCGDAMLERLVELWPDVSNEVRDALVRLALAAHPCRE